MITNKYLAALLNIIGVLFAAVVAAFKAGPIHAASVDQIIILVIGAIVIYWVPLLNTQWAGLLKVIAAGLTAAATALYPLLTTQQPLTAQDWLIVGLAVLNALGVGVGVAVRHDAIKKSGPLPKKSRFLIGID